MTTTHDMDRGSGAHPEQAIEDYEQICLHGDYDADGGWASTSIMKETLEQMGAEVQVYLPRPPLLNGYGPNDVYK